MPDENAVAAHYEANDLEARLIQAMKSAGIDTEWLTTEDLGPIDEFHLGGLAQTEALCRSLGLRPGMRVLDVGCGIGGPARHMALRWNVRVDGIDLTPAFIQAATGLTRRVGLDDRVRCEVASALALPFDDAKFDAAIMIHVGMNLPDKGAAFAEVERVLKPGGLFALYDVTSETPGRLLYPMPWAADAAISFVASRQAYRRSLTEAGFTIEQDDDRSAFVLEQAAMMRERIARDGPPQLGLHLVIGADAKPRLTNVMTALEQGTIAPVAFVARTRAASA